MANQRVLIVDDDDDLVHAMRLPLETAGYRVSRASNGQEGLRMVKGIHPDLVILDVMMDSATEGFHVTLALRNPADTSEYAAYRRIPIIILTALHSTTSLRFGPDPDYLPVDAFIDKPIGPDELLDQVREHLEKKQ